LSERKKWWKEARFGMFIHWGVYSLLERGEWVMYQEHMTNDEYAGLADRFDPSSYEPEKWVALAKDAGMRYVVLTTRHHDGFCLFDSAVSDFTAPKTAAGRDLIDEFVEACREEGMRVGFYYSLVDWRFPGVLPRSSRDHPPSTYEPMVDQAHAQVKELLSNYGRVDVLWFDMLDPHDPVLWRSEELLAMARRLQPDILINDRAGIPGDFGTPENVVRPQDRPWEACYTMNRTWGYAKNDLNYKSPGEVIRLLASCVSQNGNLLLNVGPDSQGRIPPQSVDILAAVGRWMRTNGRAIYGGGPSPVHAPALGVATRVEDRVYLLIQRWPGSTVSLAWCGSTVKTATLLSSGQVADITQRGDRVWLAGLPEDPVDPYLNVIELEFEGPPQPSDPPYQ
jgi:alpha-L-fucosidase